MECREEETKVVELALMGGFADTKFFHRTLTSQIQKLQIRFSSIDQSMCLSSYAYQLYLIE